MSSRTSPGQSQNGGERRQFPDRVDPSLDDHLHSDRLGDSFPVVEGRVSSKTSSVQSRTWGERPTSNRMDKSLDDRHVDRPGSPVSPQRFEPVERVCRIHGMNPEGVQKT